MQDNHNNLTTQTPTGSPAYTQTAELVNKVFQSLKAIFPAWKSAVPSQEHYNQMRAEWLKGLMENGISTDIEINAGLAMARRHNSPFFPSIGQFIEWCKISTGIKHPPMEACFAELTQFMADNRKDKHNLSPILYHTITRNLDYYRYRQIEKDYDRVKAFEIAFRATLFQVECGESLVLPPDPKTLIEDNSTAARHDSPESVKAAEKTVSGILAMFEEPEPKPLTQDEINDLQRLERINESFHKQKI